MTSTDETSTEETSTEEITGTSEQEADRSSPFVSMDHVTITVQDVDAVLPWYTDVLGLEVITDASVAGRTTYGGFAIEDGAVVEVSKASDDEAYDQPHDNRRMIVFKRIGGVSLTLIGHPGDTLLGTPAAKLDRLGYTHLALDVRDLPAFVERMRARGAEPIAPGFFQDPEGNIIQVQEAGHADRIHDLYRERFLTGS